LDNRIKLNITANYLVPLASSSLSTSCTTKDARDLVPQDYVLPVRFLGEQQEQPATSLGYIGERPAFFPGHSSTPKGADKNGLVRGKHTGRVCDRGCIPPGFYRSFKKWGRYLEAAV